MTEFYVFFLFWRIKMSFAKWFLNENDDDRRERDKLKRKKFENKKRRIKSEQAKKERAAQLQANVNSCYSDASLVTTNRKIKGKRHDPNSTYSKSSTTITAGNTQNKKPLHYSQSSLERGQRQTSRSSGRPASSPASILKRF